VPARDMPLLPLDSPSAIALNNAAIEFNNTVHGLRWSNDGKAPLRALRAFLGDKYPNLRWLNQLSEEDKAAAASYLRRMSIELQTYRVTCDLKVVVIAVALAALVYIDCIDGGGALAAVGRRPSHSHPYPSAQVHRLLRRGRGLLPSIPHCGGDSMNQQRSIDPILASFECQRQVTVWR